MRFVCSLYLAKRYVYHATAGRTTAHSKLRTLSAIILPMKSPSEGGVDESLAPKVRELLPARSAQMLEKRTAAF